MKMNHVMTAIAAALTMVFVMASNAAAQVRTKRPDRGVYQPEPTVFKLQPVNVVDLKTIAAKSSRPIANQAKKTNRDQPIRRVSHQATVLHQAAGLSEPVFDQSIALDPPVTSGVVVNAEPQIIENSIIHDQPIEMSDVSSCDDCGGCDLCGPAACDGIGCDSMGGLWGSKPDVGLCFAPDQWFGSMEVLLMVRSGDFFPVLATTGADANNADDTVLFGNETMFDDGTAGGRLTLGTWLDASQCRSMVLRLWSATEDDFSFDVDDNSVAVLGRPFFDVSDGITPTDEVNIVAAPGQSNGAISIQGTSDVYGGDFSLRQFWYGRYGGTVDFIYGYQYMRLDESLNISTRSQSLDAAIAPLGSVIAIEDDFDVENSFHGGQFGIASHYQEGCWSFDMLAKFGFGSLRRQVERTGVTTTSIGVATAVDPNGLLVRSTNAGKTTDHTFGWVPELDLTLGYRRFPAYDITVGYHIIAMTDALQVSGTIDPDLASNLSDPPTGTQAPSPALRFDTFYVHGVHFGLRYSY
ncbi:MAG: BBP7 family outer membrane beta-barrel protein [Planctomycetota bacterium]